MEMAAATEAAMVAAEAAKVAAAAAEKAIQKGTIAPVLEDGSKVSPRDIYLRLCACRDFEIKLQWERAVFLTAFLIACFAGYGSFLLSVHEHGMGQLSSLVVKSVPLMITFTGIILSIFWILMAKGSKAWYEHYEKAIAAFPVIYPVANVSPDMMAHSWYKLPVIERKAMSNCVLALKGGCYSVSKIVIAIGICSFAIWSSLFLIHLGIAFWGPVSEWGIFSCWDWIKASKIFGYLLIVIVMIVVIPFALTQWLRSGYLKKVKALSEEK